jgi:hypothetical protein
MTCINLLWFLNINRGDLPIILLHLICCYLVKCQYSAIPIGHFYLLKMINILENFKNSWQSETVDCSPTSGSELFHARQRCAVRHSCQMLYFFQNNVVPQFFNGMVCWHYHLQWICDYVHVYKIIKQFSASGNSSQVISSTSGQ